jgi:Ca2+-binding RTX toxin-like protein
LFGGTGDDTLLGGNGRDTLWGEAGADRLVGGAQTDTASYSTASSKVWVRLWAGDGLDGDALGDVLIDIENLEGSNFDDKLAGDDGNNRVAGLGGDDLVQGLAGDDQILGGDGADTMTGGAGNDIFFFHSAETGDDVITDFTAGAASDDVIRLIAFGGVFTNFADVLAASTQTGADVLIDLGGGDSLTLQNVSLANLHQDDFVIG